MTRCRYLLSTARDSFVDEVAEHAMTKTTCRCRPHYPWVPSFHSKRRRRKRNHRHPQYLRRELGRAIVVGWEWEEMPLDRSADRYPIFFVLASYLCTIFFSRLHDCFPYTRCSITWCFEVLLSTVHWIKPVAKNTNRLFRTMKSVKQSKRTINDRRRPIHTVTLFFRVIAMVAV